MMETDTMPTLADLMAKLDNGPKGLEDAITVIDQCAASKSAILDLQQMHLTDSDFAQLSSHLSSVASHVTSLNIFMNELTELPESLATLSELEVLHAGCNALERISPDLFVGLPRLVELDVGFSDRLPALPDSFDRLPNLRVLDAGNNRIVSLPPSLFSCARLEQLNLYGNCLKTIPAQVGDLTALRAANFGRNQIDAVPTELAQCTQLQTLHLYENCLTSLPASLAALTSLETLTVHSNEGLPMLPRHVRASPHRVKESVEFYSSK